MYVKTHDRAVRLAEEIHVLLTMHGGVYPVPHVTALIEAELLQHAANTVVERAKGAQGDKGTSSPNTTISKRKLLG